METMSTNCTETFHTSLNVFRIVSDTAHACSFVHCLNLDRTSLSNPGILKLWSLSPNKREQHLALNVVIES